MNINLSNHGMEALMSLRSNPNFGLFMTEFETQVFKMLHASVSSAPHMRVEATAYARALNDMWVFMAAASQGKRTHTLELPRGPLMPAEVDLAAALNGQHNPYPPKDEA